MKNVRELTLLSHYTYISCGICRLSGQAKPEILNRALSIWGALRAVCLLFMVLVGSGQQSLSVSIFVFATSDSAKQSSTNGTTIVIAART